MEKTKQKEPKKMLRSKLRELLKVLESLRVKVGKDTNLDNAINSIKEYLNDKR